jgi:hypothetical protein
VNDPLPDTSPSEPRTLALAPVAAPPVLWSPTFAIAVEEAVARKQAKHDFFKRVMDQDVHYGVIPGTGTKPTLLKSGAEMLLANMGLQATFSDAETPTVDISGKAHGEPYIKYRRICKVYRQLGNHEDDRMIVAQAEGSCSSWEVKYRYRSSGAACPDCGKTLRLSKDKPEWYCWTKKDGCGQVFPKARFSFERVPNPDPADVENTILKMADKRALVAATLIATGCSDIFTQDVEDFSRDDDDGSMINVTPPPSKTASKNITPITAAPSVTETPRRKTLQADVRAIHGIAKPTINAAEKKRILADISAVLGRAFTQISDVTDAELEAYVNRKHGVVDVSADLQTEAEIDNASPEKMTQRTNARLFALLNKIGIKDKPTRLAFANYYDVAVESFTQLSEADAIRLCDLADVLGKDGVTNWTWGDDAAPTDADTYCNSCGKESGAHDADCEFAAQ